MKRPSTAERKKIKRLIKRKHEALRRRYPEIRGKKIDWVTHHVNDGTLYVDVAFQDGTEFYMTFDPQIAMRSAVLWNPSKEDGEVIRTYHRVKTPSLQARRAK